MAKMMMYRANPKKLIAINNAHGWLILWALVNWLLATPMREMKSR